LLAGFAGPPVPSGRRVHLPGRGTTFVREVDGPPGAPTVLLIHGWLASGGLNWFSTFEPLSQHFRVLAPDLRGHGRGMRSRRRFRLSDCADDLDALCEVLEVERVIVVGYSLGGPVAQLLWRRHPSRIAGMVLAATGDCFVDRSSERVIFTSMMGVLAGVAGVAGLATHLPYRQAVRSRTGSGAGAGGMRTGEYQPRPIQQWAASEMRRHDWTTIFQAGRALGSYNARRWINEIDVPTTVLVSARDNAIPPGSQYALAARIPGAAVVEVDGGHTVCATERFGPAVVQACLTVADRLPAAAPAG
jgi:pimeloyl-ACP methyl ester carboxylesterase